MRRPSSGGSLANRLSENPQLPKEKKGEKRRIGNGLAGGRKKGSCMRRGQKSGQKQVQGDRTERGGATPGLSKKGGCSHPPGKGVKDHAWAHKKEGQRFEVKSVGQNQS